MASRTESAVVNVAGLVQGIVLVTFPAASTIFTEKSEYGLSSSQYGTMFLDMTTRVGASATQASVALAVFWGMVTAGRVLFAAIDRWLPERVSYHILPFVLVVTFVLVALLSRGDAVAGIAVFALAGLGCSALLPLTISFGEEDLAVMSAAVAGGIIADRPDQHNQDRSSGLQEAQLAAPGDRLAARGGLQLAVQRHRLRLDGVRR
jgi:hypothetical protein